MPAQRCSLCGINYPVRNEFGKCPVHQEPTQYLIHGQVTDNWEWLATALLLRAKEEQNASNPVPVLPLQVRKDSDGQYWISAQAVYILIHRRLTIDSVIEIPEHDAELPELQVAPLWEVMHYRDSTREYWIRKLEFPDYVPEDWQ